MATPAVISYVLLSFKMCSNIYLKLILAILHKAETSNIAIVDQKGEHS